MRPLRGSRHKTTLTTSVSCIPTFSLVRCCGSFFGSDPCLKRVGLQVGSVFLFYVIHKVVTACNSLPLQNTLVLPGFDPLNLHFQQAANFLWSHYSQEKNSWRDQPLWCYTLDRFGIVPRQISILFEANLARIARNGHFYDASSNNDAAASNNKS